jgi:selenide, water dikinase
VSPHLVLVGAGHAQIEVLRRLGDRPPGGTRITLVTRTPAATYSGMLPGVLAGHYTLDDLTIPVAPLAAHAGAACLASEATALDPVARRLTLASGAVLDYDLLSLDIGSTPDLAGAPPLGDRLVPVKPLDRFVPAWEAAEARHLARPGASVAVVGAGASGVEIALALRHRFDARGRDIAIALIERGPEIVPTLPAAVRRRLHRICAERNVAIRTGTTDTAGFDVVIWTTGAAAAPWIAASGLATDDRGFALVAPTLASLSHPEVFAAGDIATQPDAPRPKAGVFAVRQGPVLAENLSRALAGRPLAPYRPQRAWLSLIATGDRHAIATRNGITLAGRWAWTLKDRIDRRFIARYREGLRAVKD